MRKRLRKHRRYTRRRRELAELYTQRLRARMSLEDASTSVSLYRVILGRDRIMRGLDPDTRQPLPVGEDGEEYLEEE